MECGNCHHEMECVGVYDIYDNFVFWCPECGALYGEAGTEVPVWSRLEQVQPDTEEVSDAGIPGERTD